MPPQSEHMTVPTTLIFGRNLQKGQLWLLNGTLGSEMKAFKCQGTNSKKVYTSEFDMQLIQELMTYF